MISLWLVRRQHEPAAGTAGWTLTLWWLLVLAAALGWLAVLPIIMPESGLSWPVFPLAADATRKLGRFEQRLQAWQTVGVLLAAVTLAMGLAVLASGITPHR